MYLVNPTMFNSNGNKSFSLANIIEEQLSNITIVGANPMNLENDNNELTLDDCHTLESASSSPRRNSSNSTKEEKSPEPEADKNKVIDVLTVPEVRWFYKELDKTSNKVWTPFGGHDTINIETIFRSLPVELQNIPKKHSPKSDVAYNFVDESTKEAASQNVSAKVLVLGNLYEVDLISRICTSIYWPGEYYTVTRGTWFYDTWQPLDEEYGKFLEPVHLQLFLGKKCSEFMADTTTKVHSEAFAEFNVDWYTPIEIYLYSQGTPSKIVRSFTQKLGYFQKSTGTKIFRGYKDIATDADKQHDISHLVFVVHGIGQKMNIGAQIFRNTYSIRERVTSLKNKFFPDCTKRVEFFPVEWRSNLILDGGTVEAITPPHVKYLRQVLNTSAMDIMYYTSPIYMGEIQEGLVTEMNRLYTMFRERNPKIIPKVSVIAHSLGAVITYDIVTGWLPTGMPMDGVINPGKSRLNFEIDNFFCLGSPLSVFLALRVPKGHHGYHLFPPTLCNRLYNIFHLTDPVAYRLEPLVHRDYSRISPLAIHPYSATNPVAYSEMPLELIPPEAVISGTTKEKEGEVEPSSSPVETPSKEKGWSLWNSLIRGHNKSQDSSGASHRTDSPTQGLEHRLDYVLTSGTSGPLVVRSVLVSHTAYWSNYDVAFFVLTRIFPELESATPLDDKAFPSTSKP